MYDPEDLAASVFVEIIFDPLRNGQRRDFKQYKNYNFFWLVYISVTLQTATRIPTWDTPPVNLD